MNLGLIQTGHFEKLSLNIGSNYAENQERELHQ